MTTLVCLVANWIGMPDRPQIVKLELNFDGTYGPMVEQILDLSQASRRRFLSASLSGGLACTSRSLLAQEDSTPLIRSINRVTLSRNRDGEGETWFHPRACAIPNREHGTSALMTMQWIRGSDYFGPVQCVSSEDGGSTWSEPEPIGALGRIPVEGHDGLEAGVCDVVPEYHPLSRTVLALGHVVFYRGPRFDHRAQLARYPVYSVRGQDGKWSERRRLEWKDPRGAFIYTNNCGQRVVLDDGDIAMALSFGAESRSRSVAGVRCTFDGTTLQIARVGRELKLDAGRGLLEPSVTRYRDRFFMTIRAEDGNGYTATSRDGVDYGGMKPWCWDDGSEIGMSTTQQHWITHSEQLFLVYTRRDATNENVTRWRSPLWMAQVDPDQRCLVRSTERVVLPLVGDGVEDPDAVALMGNFHVTNFSPSESWVTVGEWMPKRRARGDLLMASVQWERPNRLR